MAQLVERSAVNRQVLGSIPSGGVFFSTILFSLLPCTVTFLFVFTPTTFIVTLIVTLIVTIHSKLI